MAERDVWQFARKSLADGISVSVRMDIVAMIELEAINRQPGLRGLA